MTVLSALPEPTFEDVRLSFVLRLQGEHTHLTDLTGVLGSAQANPAPAYVALEMFAHRLRGAAAVFEFPALRDAAKALENAAAAAVSESSPINEPLTLKAIRLLDGRLTSLNASSPLAAN